MTGVVFRRDKWWVDIFWPDKARFRRVCPDKATAERLALKILAARADGTWRTVRDNLDNRLAKTENLKAIARRYLEEHVKPRRQDLRTKESRLRIVCKKLGHLPVTALEPKHVTSFISWRHGYNARGKKSKKPVSTRTVNRDLSVLSDCLEWAVEQGLIARNPCRRVRRLREEQHVVPYISKQDVEAVFEHIPAEHLPFFTFIRETGCRKGEALTLRRGQVNLKRREVLFLKTKFNKERAVPLSPEAVEAIKAIPKSPSCDHVFYNPDTLNPWCDCRKPWDNAKKKAKSALRVHDLRHFYAIRLAEKGVAMHYIQYILGHRSVTTTERYYARFSPKSAQQAVLAVLEGGQA